MPGQPEMDQWVQQQLQFYPHGLPPTPLVHSPKDYGLDFEEIVFPAYLDQVPIEGWYLRCEGSQKIIIANHPLTFNRAGSPGLPGFGGPVNLMPDYKHLHDAGYHIVCYDLRNHGRSGQNFGGGPGQAPFVTYGMYESRDVVGSVRYVRERFPNFDIGLFSRCMGANSTMKAFEKYPQELQDVRCLVALLPTSVRTFVETSAKQAGFDVDEATRQVDEGIFDKMGYHLDDFSPRFSAHAVSIPTFLLAVRKDVTIDAPRDLEEIHDALASKVRKIIWIEDTTVRFDGYSWFGKNPESLVQWFKDYL